MDVAATPWREQEGKFSKLVGLAPMLHSRPYLPTPPLIQSRLDCLSRFVHRCTFTALPKYMYKCGCNAGVHAHYARFVAVTWRCLTVRYVACMSLRYDLAMFRPVVTWRACLAKMPGTVREAVQSAGAQYEAARHSRPAPPPLPASSPPLLRPVATPLGL